MMLHVFMRRGMLLLPVPSAWCCWRYVGSIPNPHIPHAPLAVAGRAYGVALELNDRKMKHEIRFVRSSICSDRLRSYRDRHDRRDSSR
uniref:Putative secreted protein n=1 Tax=Anopheles triannulatus TaxID=58253 RepID=A0A2M4B7N4_9DIPT